MLLIQWRLICSIKGQPARMACDRIRAGKVRIRFTLSPHKSFLYFYGFRDLGVLSVKTSITGNVYISITFDVLFCKYYSFLRTLLSLVLIRNLGMKSDYVLFRNLCNSNLCPFGIQTCCQSMKNPKKQLGLPFEDFFFFCKIPGLSQRERWLWENKEMAIVSKWQMLFQSRCQSTSAFQSYTVLYYCPLLQINTIW